METVKLEIEKAIEFARKKSESFSMEDLFLGMRELYLVCKKFEVLEPNDSHILKTKFEEVRLELRQKSEYLEKLNEIKNRLH